MDRRMSHFNRAAKDKSGEKERHKRTAQRQKRKGAKNIRTACCSGETYKRFPLIDSLKTKGAEKSAITTHAGKRKRAQPPISAGPQNSFIAPWEGSSNSESSFTSIPSARHFPSPPSPRLPPPNTPSEIVPNPPVAIKNTNPDSRHSVRVKRKLIPSGGPSRPQRLPPLRYVSNLSFSRSFTFSFFELPWHQSVQNRADRLKELVVMLRKIQY